MGTVFVDSLAENGWPIERFHGGMAATNPQAYVNTIAERWYELRRLVEKKLIILPDDKTLIGQLTTRKGFCNSKGQLVLESKQDMAKRGLKSPDRADGVVGCITPAFESPFAIAVHRGESSREQWLGPSLRGNKFQAEMTAEHPMYQSSRGSSRSPLL